MVATAGVFGAILFSFIWISEGGSEDVLETCSAITNVQRTSSSSTSFNFYSLMDSDERGFAVELVFSDVISNLKVNLTEKNFAYLKPVISEVLASHWVISVSKIEKKLVKNRAEFQGEFFNEGISKLTGVIVNGQLVCGDGKSALVTPEAVLPHGNRDCELSARKFEHESKMKLKEEFFSPRLGLAIDIIFASDVDEMTEITYMLGTKHSSRHYSLLNSGYVTSREEPVEIEFLIRHQNRPMPKVAALVLNDELICGFAHYQQIFDARALQSVDLLMEEGDASIAGMKRLLMPTLIVSSAALLVAIATGIFTVTLFTQSKVTPEAEPVYAMPKRNVNTT